MGKDLDIERNDQNIERNDQAARLIMRWKLWYEDRSDGGDWYDSGSKVITIRRDAWMPSAKMDHCMEVFAHFLKTNQTCVLTIWHMGPGLKGWGVKVGTVTGKLSEVTGKKYCSTILKAIIEAQMAINAQSPVDMTEGEPELWV